MVLINGRRLARLTVWYNVGREKLVLGVETARYPFSLWGSDQNPSTAVRESVDIRFCPMDSRSFLHTPSDTWALSICVTHCHIVV